MKRLFKRIYYFLPVQLFFLHFRKYQLILVFWLILVMAITGNIAPHFGANSLFLAPEYFGRINFFSMFLLGCAMCIFAMSWNITTFIIHSRRIPYLAATRHAFVVYCINNSIIPVAYFIFSSIYTIHFQVAEEHTQWVKVFFMQAGYYSGFALVLMISFSYFFAINSDLIKLTFAKITNPARIREIIPYDTLDEERDTLTAHSFISENMHIEACDNEKLPNMRVLNTVLQRQHRNVIFATFASYFILLISGIFVEQPLLKIPAGAGFLMLFSIIMGFVGAFRYFMSSWATVGMVIFIILLSLMARYKVFDLRSIAFGLNYNVPDSMEPKYDYNNIHETFNKTRYFADISLEEQRLERWKARVAKDSVLPPLVIITSSGGGLRSAYWTFKVLQYADSITHGKLFDNTVLMTGASGGMFGSAYWRGIHDEYKRGFIHFPYLPRYQHNIGKDLLNSVILSLATNDLISPFNKVYVGGYTYSRDRGYALENELNKNSDGLLDKSIGYFKDRESRGEIPALITCGTIVNDGRKLLISNQPVSFLTQPEYSLDEKNPGIDAIDFCEFFSKNHPEKLRLTSALRMNATFPLILPVVKLPSRPQMNIMDAGLRDNFGTELAVRYIFELRDWLMKHTSKVIFVEIRDTKENEVCKIGVEKGLSEMLMDPVFVIQAKWEAFQSYNHSFFKDISPYFLKDKLEFITLQYVPPPGTNIAELNFHLTGKEKGEIDRSIKEPMILQHLQQLSEMLK